MKISDSFGLLFAKLSVCFWLEYILATTKIVFLPFWSIDVLRIANTIEEKHFIRHEYTNTLATTLDSLLSSKTLAPLLCQ